MLFTGGAGRNNSERIRTSNAAGFTPGVSRAYLATGYPYHIGSYIIENTRARDPRPENAAMWLCYLQKVLVTGEVGRYNCEAVRDNSEGVRNHSVAGRTWP